MVDGEEVEQSSVGLCISSPAKSDYWFPFGRVCGLMAKAKNSTRFKNSFEAVCVFNAVCERVIIHSLCSKEYKSIGISVYSGHAYFTCSHWLICQTAPWSIPGYGRSCV